MRLFILVLFVLTIMCSNTFCKLYIWVDKDGVKHMSNIPPKEDVIFKEKRGEGFAPPLEKKEGLLLSNWFPFETKSGYTISGEVENNSKYLFKKVVVRATIRDNSGKIIVQREVKTEPYDIASKEVGKFKIENIKTEISNLSKTNLRFDLFNVEKIETGVQGKKTEQKKNDVTCSGD